MDSLTRPDDRQRPGNDLVDLLFSRGRSTYLLAALLTTMLLYPLLDMAPIGRLAAGVLEVVIIVSGIYAVSRSRLRTAFTGVLAVPTLILWFWMVLVPERHYALLPYLTSILVVFYATVAAGVLEEVLRRGPVTAEKLHGAVCGYILIALTWACLYAFVEALSPGSFVVNSEYDPDGRLDLLDFTYKSFTTLTTTGYGEIVAVKQFARALTMLEQVIGVFYVAVIIARLAGLYPPPRTAAGVGGGETTGRVAPAERE